MMRLNHIKKNNSQCTFSRCWLFKNTTCVTKNHSYIINLGNHIKLDKCLNTWNESNQTLVINLNKFTQTTWIQPMMSIYNPKGEKWDNIVG